MKKIKSYYTDGGTSQNGNFGFQSSTICISNRFGKCLLLKNIGDKTNNEAELIAILTCLKLDNSPKTIFSDSMLAINLVNKKWKTKTDRLKNILDDIRSLNAEFNIFWIPREENKAGWIIEQHLGL